MDTHAAALLTSTYVGISGMPSSHWAPCFNPILKPGHSSCAVICNWIALVPPRFLWIAVVFFSCNARLIRAHKHCGNSPTQMLGRKMALKSFKLTACWPGARWFKVTVSVHLQPTQLRQVRSVETLGWSRLRLWPGDGGEADVGVEQVRIMGISSG